jgi:hypothetical protein
LLYSHVLQSLLWKEYLNLLYRCGKQEGKNVSEYRTNNKNGYVP